MLKILGWLHLALVGLAAGFFLIMLVAGLADTGRAPQTLGYVVGFFTFIVAPLLLPSLIGGLALVLGQGWGKGVIAIASLIALLTVIGAPLAVFGLVALVREWNRPLAAPAPRPAAAAPVRPAGVPAVSRRKADQTGLLLAMAAVFLGFVVLIGGGYAISGDRAPAGLDIALWPAAAGLVAIIGVLIARARRGRAGPGAL